MARMSNRSKKRLRDKALYCKAIGDYSTARDILKTLVKNESNDIGLQYKKLKSASWVTVPSRAKVTLSTAKNYNQGDYYFSDLNCVFLRAKKQQSKSKEIIEQVLAEV
jgi:hypothetical protein